MRFSAAITTTTTILPSPPGFLAHKGKDKRAAARSNKSLLLPPLFSFSFVRYVERLAKLARSLKVELAGKVIYSVATLKKV